jgi:hypothetical protein
MTTEITKSAKEKFKILESKMLRTLRGGIVFVLALTDHGRIHGKSALRLSA